MGNDLFLCKKCYFSKWKVVLCRLCQRTWFTARHLCSTKNLQNKKSTRLSRFCAFLLLYFVVRAPCGIFEFRSCISALFSKKGIWTVDFALISAWHLQFNINLLRENKDKSSLFFYAVSMGDFLFTVRKIIIITVNRKEFSMKYKEWLDVWFAN